MTAAPSPTPSTAVPRNITSTKLSLAGLVAGLIVGSSIKIWPSPLLAQVALLIEPLGVIWMRLLQMIVVPLVITQLILSISSMGNAGAVARLGGLAIVLFVGLLALGGIFTTAAAPPLVNLVEFDTNTITSLELSIPDAALDAMTKEETTASFSDAIVDLVPSNLAKAVADGHLLQLIVIALLFGFAISRVDSPYRERLIEFFEAVSKVVMLVASWILRFTPLGVFALALAISTQTGLEIASVLLQYVLLISGLLLVFTAVLYLIAVVIGGVPLKSFARAAYPSQLIAVSTRSSLATVPTLIFGAKQTLGLPKEVVDFAVPFAAATFKPNRTISSTGKLLFLAHLFAVPLEPFQVLTFISLVIVISVTSVGVPGGGASFRTLPLYLAMGIPVEGAILAEAVDMIPDIFKTLVNTTGYLTVTTMLARAAARLTLHRVALTSASLPPTPVEADRQDGDGLGTSATEETESCSI